MAPCASLIAAEVSSSSSLDAPQNGGRVFAMRHGNRTARLGRPADQRKALIRSLVTEVLRHGKIQTTKVGHAGSHGPQQTAAARACPRSGTWHACPSCSSSRHRPVLPPRHPECTGNAAVDETS